MNFTAISPFRPVSSIHKLAIQARGPDTAGKASSSTFSHDRSESFAISMKHAATLYAQYRQFTDTQVQQWIDRARRYRGWQYMSASMLLAVFLYEIETGQPLRTTPPSAELVNRYADVIFQPFSDNQADASQELRQRQKADLWRYLTYVYSLEHPPVVMAVSAAELPVRARYGTAAPPGGWETYVEDAAEDAADGEENGDEEYYS